MIMQIVNKEKNGLMKGGMHDRNEIKVLTTRLEINNQWKVE